MTVSRPEDANLVDCFSQRIYFCWLSRLESGLQHALNDFAAACDIAGMKISTSKTEVLHFLRNLVQCSLQVSGVSLQQVEKFKYLGDAFTSDGRKAR